MTQVRETWLDAARQPVAGHVVFLPPAPRELDGDVRLSTTAVTAPIFNGLLDVDVVPGLVYATLTLAGQRFDRKLILVPDSATPVRLSSLLDQLPYNGTVGVLTASSIGTVVAGLDAQGRVVDGRGLPIIIGGDGPTLDLSAYATDDEVAALFAADPPVDLTVLFENALA